MSRYIRTSHEEVKKFKSNSDILPDHPISLPQPPSPSYSHVIWIATPSLKEPFLLFVAQLNITDRLPNLKLSPLKPSRATTNILDVVALVKYHHVPVQIEFSLRDDQRIQDVVVWGEDYVRSLG